MNKDLTEKKSEKDSQEFESDTQKIIHRHLENKDDIISEEDIRNVRIGMVPPDAITTDETTEEKVEDERDKDTPNDEPITSYDILDD